MKSIFFHTFVKAMKINKNIYSDKDHIRRLLLCSETEETDLYRASAAMRNDTIGKGVSLRGLIEISNICIKDCLYCGIRKSNFRAARYELSDEDIISAARFAHDYRYGSIVLQGGERNAPSFIKRIEHLLKEIKKISNDKLGITLSLGEQTADTYKRWFEAGAHRYLLRIETSNPELYCKIHPDNPQHSHTTRLKCIERLQQCGYQTGTGIMIGLPFQTIDDLVDDLFFIKSLDVDMVGMGPYLEHEDTPLYEHRQLLFSQQQRLQLSLHMISCLRLMMPDINIAATTALQAIEADGREKALAIGANVIMPNVTPTTHRASYKLYENKPGMDEGAEESTHRLIESVRKSGCEVILGEWGDSRHFKARKFAENKDHDISGFK